MSTAPSRSGALSVSAFCTKRRRTPGASRSYALEDRRPDVLHEAIAGSERERAIELREIEALPRAQDRLSLLHESENVTRYAQRNGVWTNGAS